MAVEVTEVEAMAGAGVAEAKEEVDLVEVEMAPVELEPEVVGEKAKAPAAEEKVVEMVEVVTAVEMEAEASAAGMVVEVKGVVREVALLAVGLRVGGKVEGAMAKVVMAAQRAVGAMVAVM